VKKYIGQITLHPACKVAFTKTGQLKEIWAMSMISLGNAKCVKDRNLQQE